MTTLSLGLFLAVTLFWGVGAYNRLVRLRAEVIRQWSSVDAVWTRLLVRMQGGVSARHSVATGGSEQEIQALQFACEDLLEALSQYRLLPLDQEWQKRVVAQHLKVIAEMRLLLQSENLAIKPDLEIAINRLRQTLRTALIPYHGAVVAYNDALAMRPASWLAASFNFNPGIRLDLSMGTEEAKAEPQDDTSH